MFQLIYSYLKNLNGTTKRHIQCCCCCWFFFHFQLVRRRWTSFWFLLMIFLFLSSLLRRLTFIFVRRFYEYVNVWSISMLFSLYVYNCHFQQIFPLLQTTESVFFWNYFQLSVQINLKIWWSNRNFITFSFSISNWKIKKKIPPKTIDTHMKKIATINDGFGCVFYELIITADSKWCAITAIAFQFDSVI